MGGIQGRYWEGTNGILGILGEAGWDTGGILEGMDEILVSTGRDWVGYWEYWGYWEGMGGILGESGRSWIGYWKVLGGLNGMLGVLGGEEWDAGGTRRGWVG